MRSINTHTQPPGKHCTVATVTVTIQLTPTHTHTYRQQSVELADSAGIDCIPVRRSRHALVRCEAEETKRQTSIFTARLANRDAIADHKLSPIHRYA